MGVLRLPLPALLTTLALACTAPSNSHPALRCGVHGECPDGLVCHADFCIDPNLDGQLTRDDFGVDGGEPDAAISMADDGPVATPRDAGAAPAQAPSLPQQPDPGDEPPASDDGMSPGDAPGACASGACCGLGLTLCGGACVDVLTALSHCGKCDLSCEPGFLCLGGRCCGEGELLCDDRCVNPQKDKHHCGACGHECEHGPCKDGVCREDP